MSIQLIVNADDYGHTLGVSAGIRQSHLLGIVTSTTAMMNMPSVEKDLRQARQECPDLGLGVHLVLTDGAPVLPAAQVHSLIRNDGCFLRRSQFVAELSSLDLTEVKAEWHAQIEKFIAITDSIPDHLDSHHHASYFSSGLFQTMLELAREYEAPIRFPTGLALADILSGLPPEFAGDTLEHRYALVREAQIAYPAYFVHPWFYDAHISRNALFALLENLPDGTSELMCHPGYADAELLNMSVYTGQRELELATLTDDEVLKFIQEHKIELTNFGKI